jgi:hypothetical protein
LRQQIVNALGLLFSLLDAFLHQSAHSLLQVAGIVHVFVELIEHRLRIETISKIGIPAAVANMHNEAGYLIAVARLFAVCRASALHFFVELLVQMESFQNKFRSGRHQCRRLLNAESANRLLQPGDLLDPFQIVL